MGQILLILPLYVGLDESGSDPGFFESRSICKVLWDDLLLIGAVQMKTDRSIGSVLYLLFNYMSYSSDSFFKSHMFLWSLLTDH